MVQLSLTYVGRAPTMAPLARSIGAACGGAFQKAGIKELVIEPWFGVFVPGGTPAASSPASITP
jgi:hypothetical protein